MRLNSTSVCRFLLWPMHQYSKHANINACSLVSRPIPGFSMLNAEKREEGPGKRSHVMEREGPEHFAGQRSLGL